MQGILLVDKVTFWTSFDVVAKIRKIIASEQKVKPALVKVGHAGTLDPMASGLLIVLIGKSYTKKANQFLKLDKSYELTARLGETTPSGDSETKPKFYSKTVPTEQEITQNLKKLTGRQMQKPPIYSAIKINGQRAYMAARKGQEPELKPRPIEVYELQLLDYSYPLVGLRTKVSSGTYIRSLAVALGERLKTGAYLTSLRRIEIGEYTLDKAIKAEDLTYQKVAKHIFS